MVNAGTFNGTDLGPGKRSGIEAFQEITDVSIMAVPGVTDANVQAKLIAHCEGLTSRFAVLDAPLECTAVDELNCHRSAYDTSYAALYAPWVQVYDPLLKRPAFLPPSGSMCGVYARTDIQRGVFKAPANEIVQGCTGLSVSYNAAEQGKLNPNGVNLIRAIPGQGILSKVITMLGTLLEITPEVIEGLFVADMEFLQDMYDTINKADKPQIQVTCPHCGKQFVDTINFQGAG